MKTLYLMRHAKSSWEDKNIEDIDRPLNERGNRNAPFMGQIMQQNGILPEEIITSSAERNLATLRHICPIIDFPFSNVKVDYNLYNAPVATIIMTIKEVPEYINSLMIVGHNPGMTDLVVYLSGTPIDNIPTCGIVELHYPRKSWMEIDLGTCEFKRFEYPKKYFERE